MSKDSNGYVDCRKENIAGGRIKLGAYDGIHSVFYHMDRLQQWLKGEPFPPLYVELSPTNRCNQRCFYCYVSPLGYRSLDMPTGLLRRVVSDMASYGVRCCEFQGTGEPLLNEGVPDAVVAGKRGGMDICLVTNGVLLNKDIAVKIVPSLSFLRFSSVSWDKKSYARLHGSSEEDYDAMLSGIENAVSVRDRENTGTVIVVTFLLFDFTVEKVYNTARIFKDMGVDIFKIWPVVKMHNAENWVRDDYHIKYSDLLAKTKELGDENFKVYLNEKNVGGFSSASPLSRPYDKCYGVEFETHIDADGKVYICQRFWGDDEFCLGDLNELSFGELWEGERRKKVFENFYRNISLDECWKFCCKQHSVNGYLYQLANPPRHVNVI